MRKTPLHPFALLGLLAAIGAAALPAPTPASGATKPSRPRARTTHKSPVRREAKPQTAAVPDSMAAPMGGAMSAAPDSGYTMPGGQEGTVFKSLTVEGEDRVHFEFERPELALDLDPHRAPGLDPGSASDVLTRSGPDLLQPFTALSATATSPCVARPWLSEFVRGPVARFRPQVTEVAHWKLTIANAKGEAVATLEGQGQPPHEILWDGRAKDGSTVTPELTYSYVFEAKDRAGNKRNFLGEGFRVAAYRLDGTGGPQLVFAAHRLAWPAIGSEGTAGRDATPPILLEAATCLNQAARPERPVEVAVTARTHDQAQALATEVVRLLAPNLVGDPARVTGKAVVEPDAPEGGTVAIAYR